MYGYCINSVYIDPTSDPGFKILFGREDSKDILMDLLNTILDLKDEKRITDITFHDKEEVGETSDERTLYYDLYCSTQDGRRFIVEMQNLGQRWFIERLLLYMSRAVTAQSRTGEWDFHYEPVIGIAFMNFTLDRLGGRVMTDCALRDSHTGAVVSDRLRMILIQLPQFRIEAPEDCHTALEKWLYTIKNMKKMETIPFADSNPIFARVDEVAKMANMSPDARRRYERLLHTSNEFYSAVKYATETGEARGEARGRAEGVIEGAINKAIEIAKKMLNIGRSVEEVAEIADLPIEEVLKLKSML